MQEKGRRLKRFLGLRRQKSRSIPHQGGIDTLQPGKLSGWVVAPGVPLHELRLLVGPHLIAKAEINQPRQDVCETLGWQGRPGFSMDLPSELPLVNWQDPPRVIALSADGSQQVQLGLLGRRKQTAELLKALLQSDLLGLVGHCDGLVMGAIRGWACRRGRQRPAQIWLQAMGLDAVPVPCHGHRDGMQSMNLPSNCGFVLEPGSLPGGWAGQEVWLSFDRESQFRLPQLASIVLPGYSGTVGASSSPLLPLQAQAAQPFQAMVESAPEDLQEHWRNLEAFRSYLDSLEQQLAQQQARALSQANNPAAPRRRWWSQLAGARS
ncbi:MAG: hypothetical protein ACKO45_00885 [Cyanobium sp.]